MQLRPINDTIVGSSFVGVKFLQAVRECRNPSFIHCGRDNFIEVIQKIIGGHLLR